MLGFLKQESRSARTENGAAAWASSMSACLDLFSTAGALRGASEEELERRFLRAWAENPDLALRIVFLDRKSTRLNSRHRIESRIT